MIDTLCSLMVMFFVFSVLGWIMEVVLKYFEFGRFINRGFLIGPYCPVYGFGVVIVTVVVGGFAIRKGTAGEIFLVGMILCGALEYFTGWYMEKLFHARWWDYSEMPMNLHGRIWIGNLILFGLACVVIVKFIDPMFFYLTDKCPVWIMRLSTVVIILVMSTDYVISHLLMNKIRNAIEDQPGDNTEEISIKIRAMLADKNIWLRRISDAFNNMQARPRKIMQEYKSALAEYRKARKKSRKLWRNAEKALHRGFSRKDAERIRKDSALVLKEAREKMQKIQDRFKIFHGTDNK